MSPPSRRLSGGSDWSAASSGSSCEASLWDWERKEPLAILPESETSNIVRRQSEVSECLSEESRDYHAYHHPHLQLPGEERRLSSQSVSSADSR